MNARIWGVIAGAVSGGCLLLAAISPTSAPYQSNLLGAAFLAPVLWWIGFVGLPAARRQDPAVWANLLWKEWREHCWKLAALTAILLGTFFSIWLGDWREGPVPMVWILLSGYTPLAALFIGMGLAAGEHARGTINSLQRLPAPTQPAAIVKLVVGLATVVLPGLALIALCWLIMAIGWGDASLEFGPFLSLFGSDAWWLETALILTLTGGSLLVWTVAIGVNHATELRAAALALMSIVGMWTIVVLAESATRPAYDPLEPDAYHAHYAIHRTLVAPLPGGSVFLCQPNETRWLYANQARLVGLSLSVVIHAALVMWWIVRYGRVGVASGARASKPIQGNQMSDWLLPPRRGRVEAILWKQFREAAPIVGGVVALAAGWTIVIILGESSCDYRVNELDVAWGAWVFAWLTTLCGFLAALMVGIGGFQDDLNPGTSTFWRSRPISPTLFYWLKYVGGLTILAVVFGGALLASYLIGIDDFEYESRYVLPGLALFLLTYATAACVACLVRSAVYAGILTILPVGYGAVIAFVDEWPLPLAVRVALLLMACTLVAAIGWQAMRRDWALRVA